MTAKHTPTPWFISRDPRPDMEWNNHIASVADPNHEICSMFHTNDEDDNATGEANAAFIVRACNSHDALVKALESCADRLEALKEDGITEAEKEALAKAVAALKLAQEG